MDRSIDGLIDRKRAVAPLNILVGMQIAHLLRFLLAIMLGGGSCWEAALAHLPRTWGCTVGLHTKLLGLIRWEVYTSSVPKARDILSFEASLES